MKRIISTLLALVMLFSVLPTNAIASSVGDKPIISVQSTSAVPNSEVRVDIHIENNVGILGATLKVAFDDKLSLVGSQSGEAFSYLTMTKPGKLVSPCKFVWDGLEYSNSDLKNGTILTLLFKVAETAKDGDELPVSISAGSNDFYDNNLKSISVSTQNGNVSVVDFTAGDVNNDDLINTADIILMRRYIAEGYGVSINVHAANVTADDYVNTADVITLRRYIAGGYDVALKRCPSPCPLPPNDHIHSLQATTRREPTCTENGNIAYWYCAECSKYFSDKAGAYEITQAKTVLAAMGHTPVVIPRVEPTPTKEGSTEGSRCGECGEVLIAPQPIAPITDEARTITYNIANGDSYLAKQVISNPNVATIGKNETYTLKNLTCDGYRFLGWYDLPSGSNASVMKKIPAGEDDVELFAHWEPIVYTVQFENSLAAAGFPTEITYTVNKGVTLESLKLSNYVFTGWSDLQGNLYKRVPVGTTGDITLIANWTSERNKTWTKKKLDAPVIVEDEEDGVIMFAYEIGTVENVPVYTVHDFGYISENGVSKTYTETYSVQTSETLMKNYTTSVANATTKSSSWTLSEDWNETTDVNESWMKENGYTREQIDTIAKTDATNWNISNSTSGSSTTTSMSSNSNSDSNDVKIAVSDQSKTNKQIAATVGTSTTVSAEVSATASAKAKYPGAEAGVEATAKAGVSSTISGSLTATASNEKTHEQSLNMGQSNSTVKASSDSTSSTSGWNSESSYGGSSSTSKSNTASEALSEKIASTYGYGKSYSNSTGSVAFDGTENTASQEDSYSTAVTYDKTEQNEVTETWSTENTKAGYHRWIKTGKAHVFGVVSYDIATQSYFVSTYSVMDDANYKDFEDYSLSSSDYTDHENGVIPFEIPAEVQDYVADHVAYSEGLRVNEKTGVIERYEGTDDLVVIPEYITTANNNRVIKVTGISETAFAGNKSLKAVILSDYITEIPAHAFEDCTALCAVSGKNITGIGESAFAGCTSYAEADLSAQVTTLGKNAFDGVENLYVFANNASVVENAMTCKTQTTAIYLNHLNEQELEKLEGKKLETFASKRFALNGFDDTLKNVSLVSNAAETYLIRCNFSSTESIPLTVCSGRLILDNTKVSASGFAALIDTAKTEVGLQGNSAIKSSNEIAVLCRNLSLYEFDPIAVGKLAVTGKLIVCGKVENTDLLNCDNVVYADEETFQNYLHSYTLSFDANGGSCSEASRKVANGVEIGELPTPTREYYNFEGWYTKKDDGESVKADKTFSTGTDITLYAHWSPCRFTVTFDANGGNASEASRELSYLNELGRLPDASRDYYYFDGWFTERDGGTKLDANYVFDKADNVTLYAHWTQKEVSGWVHESEQPANSQCVEEKWNYWETFYTENTATWLDGWERYDAYWIKSGEGSFYYADFPSGFDTGNWYYQNYEKGSAGAYENETNKRDVQTWRDGWIYWHWMYDCGGANGHSQRAILPWKGTGSASKFYYKYFYAFDSTTDYSYGGTSYTENTGTPNWIASDRTANSQCGGSTRWFRFDRNGCAYQDYYRMFKYRRSENKDSGSYPSGNNISSVNRYVRYRMK